MLDIILSNKYRNKKAILLWYGNKIRAVPLSVIYRKFNVECYFYLPYLTDAVSVQIYCNNVIRIRYKNHENLYIEDASQKTIDVFSEILNSDEDYFAIENRFKAVEIDKSSGIHIIVNKKDLNGISYKELPIKVYGFLKPMRLSTGEITFSYQNMCDELLQSELADIEENLKDLLKSTWF